VAPRAGLIRLMEVFKHARQHVAVNAITIIFYGNLGPGQLGPQNHLHFAPIRCELDGVGEELEEHLAQALRVCDRVNGGRCAAVLQRDVIASGHRAHRVHDIPPQGADIHGLDSHVERATLDIRDVEHLGDGAAAKRIQTAVVAAIRAGECTRDLGGSLSTREAGDAIIRRLGD